MPAKRAATTAIALAAAAVLGCAHRRPAYSAGDRGRGVHVRAPFVDVHVQGPTKSSRPPQVGVRGVDDEGGDED